MLAPLVHKTEGLCIPATCRALSQQELKTILRSLKRTGRSCLHVLTKVRVPPLSPLAHRMHLSCPRHLEPSVINLKYAEEVALRLSHFHPVVAGRRSNKGYK